MRVSYCLIFLPCLGLNNEHVSLSVLRKEDTLSVSMFSIHRYGCGLLDRPLVLQDLKHYLLCLHMNVFMLSKTEGLLVWKLGAFSSPQLGLVLAFALLNVGRGVAMLPDDSDDCH